MRFFRRTYKILGGVRGLPLVLVTATLLAGLLPNIAGAAQPALPTKQVQPRSKHCSAWRWIAADLAETDCTFSRDGDKIVVADRNGNGLLDFDEDTWLFDVAFNEGVELIVQFDMQGPRKKALIYDDVNEDRQVSYVQEGSNITVTETTFPTVTMEVEGDWWLPNGDLNYNQKITVDGAYLTIYGSWTVQQMRETDNVMDWIYTVVDADKDGTPEYWTYQLLTPIPRSWGVTRFSSFLNVGKVKPVPLSDSLFWPYLQAENAYENFGADPAGYRPGRDRMFSTSPFIEVGWPIARVVTAGFRGYPIEDGMWINSQSPAVVGEPSPGNFENPHAWYDLAQDKDGSPELNVRVVYWNGGDPNYPLSIYPLNEIRYSWNQSNGENLAFDYKLGLVGQHEVDTIVEIGQFDIEVQPYAELPRWIVDQSWHLSTFISTEGRNYQTSEGIYEWAPATSLDGQAEAYVNGLNETPPLQEFHPLDEQMRGEYAIDLNGQPWLYFSAIDRKLHLRRSNHGHWNIGGGTVLWYDNLGGDYMNAWRLERNGQTRQRLYATADHLIFARGSKVVLRKTALPAPVFETLPPTNHQEWRELGEQLERNKGNLAPGDLQAMFEQFTGPEIELSGVSIQSLRLHSYDNGFRFVADVAPGAVAKGEGAPSLAGLAPGVYVFTFDGDNFTVAPQRPASLTLDVAIVDEVTLQKGSPVLVQVMASNAGAEDVLGSTLIVESIVGSQAVPVFSGPLDVLAGEAAQQRFSVPLWREDEWEIRVRLENAEGEILVEHQQHMGTVIATLAPTSQLLALSSLDGYWIPAVGMLVLLGIGMALSVALAGGTVEETP